jgi:hypothetical protein
MSSAARGIIMKPCVTILSFALAAAAALGQDAPAPGAGAPDKRLAYFVGTWDVSVRYKLGDKEQEGKSLCQTKAVLEGKFIQQDYTSKMMGQPLLVRQTLGYDTLKKKFVEFQLHVHGPSTHTMQSEGTFSDDGKVLTLSGDSVSGMTGKPVKLRTVTTIADENHYTLEWFVTEAGGKEERQVVLIHTRKPS